MVWVLSSLVILFWFRIAALYKCKTLNSWLPKMQETFVILKINIIIIIGVLLRLGFSIAAKCIPPRENLFSWAIKEEKTSVNFIVILNHDQNPNNMLKSSPVFLDQNPSCNFVSQIKQRQLNNSDNPETLLT